jgi:hypothetical protein
MTDTNEAASRPIIARVLAWVAAVVLIPVLVLGAARFFIPTISPDQAQPPGHYFEPCATCHLSVAGAELIDVE